MAANYKTLTKQLFDEVWNKGNLGLVADIFAPDFENKDPNVPAELKKGPDAYRNFVTMYRTAYPDVRLTIEDIVSEGDRGYARWTATGTQKGPLGPIPATGKKTTTTGIVWGRVKDGKFVEGGGQWDNLGLLRQLGVVPA